MCFLGESLLAQQGSVKIILTNNDHNPLSNASVFLLNAKDSQIIKIQVSDTTGVAAFSTIAAGDYLIKATHVGYKDFISSKKITVHDESLSLNIQMMSVFTFS